MTRLWAAGLIVVAGILPNNANAGLLPPARTYKKMDILGNGYKDRAQKDGTWKISTQSRRVDGDGFATEMAIFRAAELTKESNHRYFQILDARSKSLSMRGTLVNQMTQIIVRPSDEASAPGDCRSKNKENCVTLEADSVISRIAPTLKR